VGLGFGGEGMGWVYIMSGWAGGVVGCWWACWALCSWADESFRWWPAADLCREPHQPGSRQRALFAESLALGTEIFSKRILK
jgi:hypothetical protein